jgi:hypothetical protein
LPNKTPVSGLNEKKSLTSIKCECGAEILLVPDLKAMNKAIENHAFEHGKVKKDSREAASEVERILQLLTVEVLEKILEYY